MYYQPTGGRNALGIPSPQHICPNDRTGTGVQLIALEIRREKAWNPRSSQSKLTPSLRCRLWTASLVPVNTAWTGRDRRTILLCVQGRHDAQRALDLTAERGSWHAGWFLSWIVLHRTASSGRGRTEVVVGRSPNRSLVSVSLETYLTSIYRWRPMAVRFRPAIMKTKSYNSHLRGAEPP